MGRTDTAGRRPRARRRTTLGTGLVLAALVAGGVVAASAASGSLVADRVPAEHRAVLAQAARLEAQPAALSADPQERERTIARKQARHAAELHAQQERSAAGLDAVAPWPRGVVEDAEAPARGAEYLGTNRWVGPGGAGTLAVWAGCSGQDPTLGRVLVGSFDADLRTVSRRTVDLAGSGPLRIISAEGVVLTIADAHGDRHRFNAATGSFG